MQCLAPHLAVTTAEMKQTGMCCRMENTAVARVSDDFYPTDAASWTCHLGICAYNSLFMAPLVQVCTFHSPKE